MIVAPKLTARRAGSIWQGFRVSFLTKNLKENQAVTTGVLLGITLGDPLGILCGILVGHPLGDPLGEPLGDPLGDHQFMNQSITENKLMVQSTKLLSPEQYIMLWFTNLPPQSTEP